MSINQLKLNTEINSKLNNKTLVRIIINKRKRRTRFGLKILTACLQPKWTRVCKLKCHKWTLGGKGNIINKKTGVARVMINTNHRREHANEESVTKEKENIKWKGKNANKKDYINKIKAVNIK